MIPRQNQPFKVSRTAMAIMVASILLASLLAVATIRNINREQQLMGNFLHKEGLTIIRALEAGARTSLMHYTQGNNPLVTLVAETAKTDTVAYIKIIDEQGGVIAKAGEWPQAENRRDTKQIRPRNEPITTLYQEEGIFEIASTFQPLIGNDPRMGMMRQRWQQWCPPGRENGCLSEQRRQFIIVGLQTGEFDQARHEDVRHGLLMGGILFLLGCAGFYFLFLYQGIRVARATLADMELYTENVIESMPVGLITLDKIGHIVSCNSKGEELAGKAFVSLQNKEVAEIFPAWPVDLLSDRKALINIPLDCPREDGEQIPVQVSASSLLGQDGQDLGMVLILRDVREIRAMELQLERSRRLAALGQMAAGIAHEIRNPLSTLRGFAQFFKKQFSDNDDGREYAGLMISEVDRLNQTISALLQFARPRQPEFQEVDPCPLLAKAGQLLKHDFSEKHVSLDVECMPGYTLHADPDLLLQVLINLLKNSLSSTLTDGSVELGFCLQEGEVVIWVQDSGRGMSLEEQEQMFNPFYTTKKRGTGLGLAVSHQIIEQHQGRFVVDSRLNKGTRIEMVLPISGEE